MPLPKAGPPPIFPLGLLWSGRMANRNSTSLLACRLLPASLCMAMLAIAESTAVRAAESELGTFNFVFENDAFAGRDRDYTNGVLVSWTSGPDQTPSWATATAHWLT